MFNKQIKFNLVSPLAQLDKTKYKKSPMYKGTPTDNAYDALKAVFSDCEYDNYLLDGELKNVFLTGYIPVCTHKEAIQQIAFVCGYLVFDNRGRPIEVKPFSTDTPQEIESSSIFDPIKVEKKESVTGLRGRPYKGCGIRCKVNFLLDSTKILKEYFRISRDFCAVWRKIVPQMCCKGVSRRPSVSVLP